MSEDPVAKEISPDCQGTHYLPEQIASLQYQLAAEKAKNAEYRANDFCDVLGKTKQLLNEISSLESQLESEKAKNADLERELKIQDDANEILEKRTMELEEKRQYDSCRFCGEAGKKVTELEKRLAAEMNRER